IQKRVARRHTAASSIGFRQRAAADLRKRRQDEDNPKQDEDNSNSRQRDAHGSRKEGLQMKIIVTERIAEEGIQHLKDRGHDVDVRYGISPDELLGVIENYDAIIVRSVTKVNAELLERAKNLKV